MKKDNSSKAISPILQPDDCKNRENTKYYKDNKDKTQKHTMGATINIESTATEQP